MKRTLIDMTQDILSDGDSDEVNSINDTVEAMQVARIIRTTYEEIISSRQWPHLSQLTSLTPASDTDTPTHFTMGDDVQYIEWIKYNNRLSATDVEAWIDVKYLQPKAFLDLVHARVSTNTNTQVVDDGTAGNLLITLDKQPEFWTTFDDETIIMDSIDNTIVGQATLTAERVQASAYVEPAFSLVDTFIPDLPSKSFSYLLAESKSVAFATLFQEVNSKEEQKSRRQRVYTARNSRSQNKDIRTPDYGRKPASQGRTRSDSTDAPTGNRPSYLPN